MRAVSPLKVLSQRFFSPVRTLVTEAQGFDLALRTCPKRVSKEIIVTAAPTSDESRDQFKKRMMKMVSERFINKDHADHELFLSYPTRVANKDETLTNSLSSSHLPLIEKTLLPGHCLLAFIDAQGFVANQHTISLRPDMHSLPFYKAKIATDERLPQAEIKRNVFVRPALHSTWKQEVMNWADDAFYAHYVHRTRPRYPLHCILKPVANAEDKKKYLNLLTELKTIFTRYSLLDHLHPHTGETLGDVVSSQNCTVVAAVIARLLSCDFRQALGDNPTPQLVTKIVKEAYFKFAVEDLGSGDFYKEDGLGRVYKRG